MSASDLNAKYAIYAITKHGLEIGARLFEALDESDYYVSHKFIERAPQGAIPLRLPMEPALRDTFHRYDCHVFIISIGAVVRMIAPLLADKKTDPAVVCVDDKAQFTISVLSGHVGKGNLHTTRLSEILNNTPVITTASDVGKTLTVDILGRDLGWVLADQNKNVTRGCAAVVNETRVLFVQECGEPDWWPLDKKLPKGVEYAKALTGVNPLDFEILLIASDRRNIADTHPHCYENAIIYHPKTLILGLGADKSVPLRVVENGIVKILEENGLAIQSVKAIASVENKKEEPAFKGLSEKYGWEFQTFPAAALDQAEGIENPSDAPKKFVGTRSVSEASALLAARAQKLLVPKQKYNEGGKNVTIAVARIEHPLRSVFEVSEAAAP